MREWSSSYDESAASASVARIGRRSVVSCMVIAVYSKALRCVFKGLEMLKRDFLVFMIAVKMVHIKG